MAYSSCYGKGWSYARNIKVLGDGNGICIQCNDGAGVWKGIYIYINRFDEKNGKEN